MLEHQKTPEIRETEKRTREAIETYLDVWEREDREALLAIYALLAIPLRSYVQPFIIMGAIPFGLVGAVWGHVLMRHDVSMFSLIGLVALSGVVVNDSLVLVDWVNRARRGGLPLSQAIREAGVDPEALLAEMVSKPEVAKLADRERLLLDKNTPYSAAM